ncbi:MAG: hypothetical protein ACO3RT_06635 [Arenicellales bacterium]|jgi:mono/diheme cytochrome c family protein|nr:hypothetical protein [Gammaproteobacteria bacterium]NDA14823.1 hypothetical protein [Gammaproteobacteria bacterium]NDG44655.1 hypothetical protein [Gammaproteobacteria bacterium]
MRRALQLLLVFCGCTISTTSPWADPVQQGLDLSIQYCSRCHVIGEYNRLGGIGNTPSFNWMVKSDDWRERFTTFYTRRPHPVFARVPGYPLWSESDPYYPPFEITIDEIEAIAAYAESLIEKN